MEQTPRKWFEYNATLIGLFATFVGALFFIFNIHATGVNNSNDIKTNTTHISQHCTEITERKIVDERIESKLDVLLMLNKIDPAKVKQTDKYLVTDRGIEFDTLDAKKYLESLALE